MLPCNIKSFCNEMGGNLMLRDGMVKECGNIIDSFLNGKNPNDIIFKNNIIEALNKISQKNYIQILLIGICQIKYSISRNTKFLQIN